MRRRRKIALVAAAAVVVLIAPLMSYAQSAEEGYNIHTFQPTGLESGAVTLEGSPTLEPMQLGFGLTYSYADTPVQLVGEDDQSQVLAAVIDSSQLMQLRASLGVVDGLEATLVAPFLVSQSVDPNFSSVASSGLGDLGLLAKYALFPTKAKVLRCLSRLGGRSAKTGSSTGRASGGRSGASIRVARGDSSLRAGRDISTVRGAGRP